MSWSCGWALTAAHTDLAFQKCGSTYSKALNRHLHFLERSGMSFHAAIQNMKARKENEEILVSLL